MQGIFLHSDCWSRPLNGLIDLRYNLWDGKYEVRFNEIYWKSVSHHKIWFLTNFNQMQLISCTNKAFFTDLTFDLYFKNYLLTSDLNINLKNTKSLCIKFTDWLYFTQKIEFLIKCSLFQVVQQIYDIFGLNCALCIKSMTFGMLVQLTKGNIFRYGGVAAAPPGGRWRHLLVSC